MGILGNPDHERFCQTAHKRIWSGEKHVAAYQAAYCETIYQGDDPTNPAVVANVRKLRNRKDVKARLAELAEYSGRLAGIDASWALLKLKTLADFNVDDYLTPPDANGLRLFNVGGATPEQMSRLIELTMEEFTEGHGEAAIGVRKTKIKGHDPIAALTLMARIAGWEAPKKIAPTTAEGETLTLEQLIRESMTLREARKAVPAATE